MIKLTEELVKIATDAEVLAQGFERNGFQSTLEKLEKAVESAARSWSGSWLGYHSRIYYKNLEPAPPGARFDPSWAPDNFSSKTCGEWAEYSFEEVYNELKNVVTDEDYDALDKGSHEANKKVRELQENLLSILESVIEGTQDTYLERLIVDVKKASSIASGKFIGYLRPSGRLMSADMVAIQGGLQTPPHIAMLAKIKSMQSPFTVAGQMAELAKRTERHILNRSRVSKNNATGTNVFIGHGRATAWRDLKDFIKDRLKLPWDEFNRVPVAGVTNIARLSDMLNESAIAFLVMTAEDEQLDGKKHARMNVIHEAGLFQGRLGFSKAIVVLEEGCEEFSNIQGLGQLRFPAGNIKACFEEIRQVLEREGLIER